MTGVRIVPDMMLPEEKKTKNAASNLADFPVWDFVSLRRPAAVFISNS